MRSFLVIFSLAGLLCLPGCGEDGLLPGAPGDEPGPGYEGFSSTLPLLTLDSQGVEVDADDAWDETGRAWIPVDAVLREPGSGGLAWLEAPPSWSGSGGVHVRGNTSANYDKKSYALETWDSEGADTDVSLLGMPEEEDWVLLGPYSDKTLMRNHLMYTWSRDIGRYAARTRFVEVFLSEDGDPPGEGNYRGVYVLMEKIKRDSGRVDLKGLGPDDNTEPEVSGGYLLKRDWVDPQVNTVIETETYDDVLMIEYPRKEAISPEQVDWIQAFLDSFEEALEGPDFQDPELGYAAWIDVDTFIDHQLLVEIGRNVDGYVLSTWLYKDRDGRLSMGPIWDYNGALGNADYFQSWDPEGWHFENPEFPEDNPNGYHWYTRLWEDPAYLERLRERWEEHRSGPLSTESMLARIEADSERLQLPAERNFERWPVLGEYVWPNSGGWEERDSYEAEVEYLGEWLTARLEWMDSEIEGLGR